MKKLLIVAALALASLFGGLSAANAGQACYDVQVTVQGSPVVSESGCQPIEVPAPPA